MLTYTKVKVQCTQDKHMSAEQLCLALLLPKKSLATTSLHTQDKYTQLSSFAELYCYPIKSLADTNLPDYVDAHSLPTGYLRPCELDTNPPSSAQAVIPLLHPLQHTQQVPVCKACIV